MSRLAFACAFLCAFSAASASASAPEDLEARARAALASHPIARHAEHLVVERAVPTERGGLVRFSQTFEGLPVEGSAVIVRLHDARALYVLTEGLVRFADGAPRPAISADSAITIVRARLGTHLRAAAEPVIIAKDEAPIAAYRVFVEGSADRTGYVVVVRADTGAIASVRATTLALDGARVYAQNPVKTPALIDVTLTTAPSESHLVGELSAHSCIDTRMCVPTASSGQHVYRCVADPRAVRDMNGDFFAARPALDTDPTDAFAEVQAYYHVHEGLERFRAFSGLPSLTFAEPVEIRVNHVGPNAYSLAYCGPSTTPDPAAALVPVDNASFVARNPSTLEPAMLVFGQGEKVDFAYDGDVVYHELAHAMQAEVGAIGPYYLPDGYGMSGDVGALSEGFADFWSSAITGDPELGEYVAAAVTATPPQTSLRSIAGTPRCPEALIGEAHEDGILWGSSLWALYTGTEEAERAALLRALFLALSATTNTSTMRSMAMTVETEVAAALGEAARARAHTAFEARGIFDDACDARVIDVAVSDRLVVFLPPSVYGAMRTEAASPLQLAVSIPTRARTITVTAQRVVVATKPLDYDRMPKAKLLVKCGGRIHWGGDPVTHDAEREAQFVFTGDASARDGRATATVRGRFRPGTTCHLQIVNEHDDLFVFAQTSVALDATVAAPDDGCSCRAGRRDVPRAYGLYALVVCGVIGLRVRARVKTR